MKKLLLTLISLIFIFNLQAQIVTGFNNITDTDGNTHSLSNYLNNGKIVVLNFYILTCGNCMATAPKIESIYQNYGQNQCNVVVLSFNITNPATNLDCDNFATTYGNPSPPNFNYTEASWSQFYTAYGGSFAQTYVVTPDGDSVIYAHAGGVLNQPAIESVLNNAIANTSNITSCDSYTWPVNGNTYTASGIHTYPSPCPPYTETLNLTITNSTTSTDVQVHCDSYIWIDGNTYIASNNTATFTTINAAGCDNVANLNLTINNSTSNATTITACNSYIWAVDGNTYSASGTYTNLITDPLTGCNHTETLVLTISNFTTNTHVQTACNTYTWPAPLGDGSAYTTSGTYTHTSTNAVGCIHTETLNLTINNSTSSYDTLSFAENLWWMGILLDEPGDYSDTLINSSGCDSIVNLNLTVTTTGILDVTHNKSNLFKTTNMLGQETLYRKKTLLFYLYDDGKVEKRIVIE